MQNNPFTKVSNPVQSNSARTVAVLCLGVAGVSSAGSVTVDQLHGHQAYSVIQSENTLLYVTLPAASADISTLGAVNSRLSVRTPGDKALSISLNHARNEDGTLFVYLNVNTSNGKALHRKLPLTVTNTMTGKSVTINIQVNAVAAPYR